MADSVRFPTNIGGSGRTYTSDANPDTGVFNGGHRINFFPMLADTVAAAGYVSQYAQAIDGAKANADRAEDARGYVEAVADAYNVNLLDQFKRKATLGLDFVEGRYWKDDGERFETSDPAQIVNFERNTTKWEEGPSGILREVEPNVLAREWKGGLPQGVSINESRTNLLLASGDLTDPAWLQFNSETDAGITLSSKISPIDGTYYSRYEVISDARFTMLIYQDFQLTPDERYIFSFFVSKSYKELRYLQIDTGANNRSIFDVENGSFVVTNSVVHQIDVDDVGSGWRVKVNFSASDSAARCGVSPRSDSTIGYNKYYSAGDYVDITGFQLEIGSVAASYIPTATSPVTRSADVLSVALEGQLNRSLGTLYSECYVVAAKSFSGAGNIFGMYKDSLNYWQFSQTSFSAVRLYVVIEGATQEIYTALGYSGGANRKYIATYRNGLLNIYTNGVRILADIPIGDGANTINLSGVYAAPANNSPAIKRAKNLYYLPSWTGSEEAQELTTQ